MASIIDSLITENGFELVNTKLGVILLEELSNQKETFNAFENNFEVFVGRQEAYDKSEDVVINVSFDNANFSGKTQNDVQGNDTYFIDIYCQGVSSSEMTSSVEADKLGLRFAGLIRSILSSTKYKTLGFNPGLIGGTMVESIQSVNQFNEQDANSIKFVRVTFSARVQENQSMWQGVNLLGNDTTIKLDLTNKGYKLTFN
jgi:hypothetical protein